MRGPRTLRSRLFSWFFGAILLAIITSAVVVGTTRTDSGSGVEATAATHMAGRLARDWDDPGIERAYLEEIRDVTGLEARLVRDARRVPAHVRRVADHGGTLAPGADRVFVPVVRDGTLLGALEMTRPGERTARWVWWRLPLTLVAVMAVLSLMANRVANLLARPLEHLARAADRFGGGDLSVRADVGGAGGWVAAEVREVAVSYNRMADRVEATVRGQRELLGAISHELRSPLGRARVALEIARDRAARETPSERSTTAALEDIDRELGGIDTILGELLDVTRAGLADLRTEVTDIEPWIRARIADEPVPPEITLLVPAGAGGVTAPLDGALLGRALHNLLVNARAHGHPPDRPIDVRMLPKEHSVEIVVRDRGPGFARGFAERAFEPFVRGDSSRSRPTAGAGYGLGLAIVRRVVEAHGGRAFARNAVDGEGGAEVGFDLPRSAPNR